MIYSLQMRQPRGRDQKRVQHLGMSVLTALEGHLETVRDLLSVSQRCSQQQSRGKWPRGVYSKSSVQDRTGFDLIFPPNCLSLGKSLLCFHFPCQQNEGTRSVAMPSMSLPLQYLHPLLLSHSSREMFLLCVLLFCALDSKTYRKNEGKLGGRTAHVTC